MEIIDFNERQIVDFLEKKRPPVEIRSQLDIGYSFENNTLEIFEIRPQWNDETKTTQMPMARCKYVKSKYVWKIYWMPSSLKWTAYEPKLEVKNISEFLTILEEDVHNCFWG